MTDRLALHPDGCGRSTGSPLKYRFELAASAFTRPTTPLLEGDKGSRGDHSVSSKAALADSQLPPSGRGRRCAI